MTHWQADGTRYSQSVLAKEKLENIKQAIPNQPRR
jgi:hypothetical protein